MSISHESKLAAQSSTDNTGAGERRGDIESKQQLVADLLRREGCEVLICLRPENFAWLTAGGTTRGVLHEDVQAGLYFNPENRWILCSNVETQRLFDEEADGLGFQVKEWPWYVGRKPLLTELRTSRKAACDVPMEDCTHVGDELAVLRRSMSDYERACYRALGQIVSHALEATGRTLLKGESEREVAGQLCHRLIHRGVQPVMVMIAADGRAGSYRQAGYTSAPIRRSCVISVVGRKYGLYAQASRSLCFGSPDSKLRKEHDAACKVSATYVASAWPDSVPKQILAAGKRVFQLTGFEHDWMLSPQGHVTGRVPVELEFTPRTEELLQDHWAVTWLGSVGAALSCDTFLLSEEGPKPVTLIENWPLKKIRIQGAEFTRPDLLVR